MSVQISYKKQTAFFILSLLVVLAVLESGSRIYEYIQPDCFLIGADATKNLGTELQNQMCEEISLLKSNEYPVFENEPNQHLTTININSLGFRGSEFDLIKNDNTYRIMMLGGSTAFGAGASSDTTTIPAYLEKEFRKNNYNVEVINAGILGSDSFEEAYKIRYMFKKFQPDLFIVYDGWNDSFGQVKEGTLNPDITRSKQIESEKPSLQIWISKNLTEFRTLYVFYPISSHLLIASTMNEGLLIMNSEIWSSRWNDVCSENNDDGIKTIILLQPIVGTGNKKLSSEEKHHADYFKQIKSREQLEYHSKKLVIASCTASIDLRNTFDNVSEPIYYDGGHMTDLGNKIVAAKIYEEILPVIITDVENP